LLSALIARLIFKQHIARSTWIAIVIAGMGMAWMFIEPRTEATSEWPWGTLIAFIVPLSAAVNWNIVQHAQTKGQAVDMVPAVLVGALLSAAATLPFAFPFQATVQDVAWLSMLGLVQLAIPCTLVVLCARVLPAAEISLLALLEVVFGTLLVWLFANEDPSFRVLTGGMLVLVALLFNAWWTRELPKREVKDVDLHH
jgi:drug/metabolite transporter (DMT)-like permease